jgi:hypothetical protein
VEEGIAQSLGQITSDGIFPGGVKVADVIRFIRDYDYEADIDDVARHFKLEPDDVAAAISFHDRNFDWLHHLVLEGGR